LVCSADGGVFFANFAVETYGTYIIEGVNELNWPSQGVDRNKAQVIQQWVSENEANVTLSLPPLGEQFSRILVIQTQFDDGAQAFTGSAAIGTQDEESSAPVYGDKLPVTCVINF
jgi:hypothetical protein